jgi:hypothetical protein
MDNQKIIEEVLQTDGFKNLLKEVLAQKISNEYHFRDTEGELIKREVRVLIVEEAKTAIKELIEEYYDLDNVKDLIKKEIRSFTKKELIDLINK